MICPCGSNKDYSECCAPLHEGKHTAASPEALMRSRYSAFALGLVDYLLATSLHHAADERLQLEATIGKVQWLGLEVLEADGDTVEFKAYYRDDDALGVLHEKSSFVCKEGRWFYDSGELFNTKIERNAPCPCGSGKKYKKCCM